MKITNVTIRKAEREDSRMKAIASVLLDDEFAVHDIKVIEGDQGVFIAMPSKKNASGEYKDIAHPINTEARKKLSDAVIDAYNRTDDTTTD